MKKRILSLILVLSMLVGMFGFTVSAESESSLPFNDVEEERWFYEPVKFVYENKLMEGFDKEMTTFAPLDKMTRAQIVTIFYRLAGATDEGLGELLKFTDTPQTSWYANYLGWAVKNELVNGYPEGDYKPNNPINRQELAKLIVVFMKKFGFVSNSEPMVDGFVDAAEFQPWAAEYIEQLRLTGIVGGDNDGKYNPKSTATRAEIAMILSRFPMKVSPESVIADLDKYFAKDAGGKPNITLGSIYGQGTAIAEIMLGNAILNSTGLDVSAYTVVFEKFDDIYFAFRDSAFRNCDHGETVPFETEIKFAFKNIESEETTEFATLSELTITKNLTEVINNSIAADGTTLYFDGDFDDEAYFTNWLRRELKALHDEVVLDSFDSIKSAYEAKGSAEFNAVFTLTTSADNDAGIPVITTERTYKVDFTRFGELSSTDPNPDNIGTVYEDASGLKISEAIEVLVPDAFNNGYAAGNGIHGWHESRIVRTKNGTYVTYISDEKHDEDDYQYLHDFPDEGPSAFTWDKFSVIKITSDGCKLILEDWFPHALGSCTPNIGQTSDGHIYISIIAEDKAKYFNSWLGFDEDGNPLGFSNEGAWLKIYDIDTVTDTYTNPDEKVFKPDFELIGVHGYGYSQPILDEKVGKMYAIFDGGEVPGYWAWFIYDLETHTWDPECYTVEIETRNGYMNAYPDGNGGFYFVCQRQPPAEELGKLIDVEFRFTGYLWDTVYIMAIPDAQVEECIHVHTTFEPSYPVGESDVHHAAADHYANGTTYIDSRGNLHIIYTVSDRYSQGDTRSHMYHAVYDIKDNYKELKNDTIDFSETRYRSFKVMMNENESGDIFIIAYDTSGIAKELKVEVYRSSDGGMTFKNICKPKTVTIKGTDGEKLTELNRVSSTNSRNFSLQDGIVGFVTYRTYSNMFTDSLGRMDSYAYQYISVELPE